MGDDPPATAMPPLGAAALRAVEPDRRTALLAAGDVAAVVGVLVAGMRRHGVDPLAEPGHAAAVVGPFVVGWLLAAPLVGAYAADLSRVGPAANGWLLAALVGLSLRATPAFPGGVTGPFGFVVSGFGLLAVGGWRLLAARLP